MANNETKYFLADIETLIPYARNARTHSETQIAQIAASIKEFGFLSPIVIAEDNTILCGHGRFYGAQKLGLKKVPCVMESHLTENQRRAYILADNKLSLNAGWDNDMLAVELSELQDNDFDLSVIGFDESELADLFDDGKKSDDDDFDVDEALEQPHFSKPGDLWILGKHKVLCGDATLPESYTTLLESDKVNLVLSDLPYFVSYKGTAGTIKNDDLADDEAYEFTLKAMKCMYDAMANDASIYIFHSDSKGLIFRRAFNEAGFYLSSCCIWKKDSLVLGRSPYQWITESILFGWKKKGKHCWYTGRSETNCWEYAKPKKNASHPTAKPIPLMAYPIKNSTMTNGIVLDPFLGSGATMIACEQTQRVCRGMEIDTKYMDVIVRRFTQYKQSWDDVRCLRNGNEMTLEEVVSEMDEPVKMTDFLKGVDGAAET
ncbi:MAG: site-specific DNA-methyltransferase [Acutalibacteraceae bacterium]|nr:site-specific DNA-methyltransferase [Acutalibacteraceae bacterium]